jgi:hypothetical protein
MRLALHGLSKGAISRGQERVMARAKSKSRYPGDESGSMVDELEREEEEMERAAEESVSFAKTRGQNIMDAFDAFGGPMARVMDCNRAILQKLMHAMQEESLNFVNRRLERTTHAIEHSRECHGVSGLMAVQQEWMLDFARDYAEQTKRFTELMRQLAEEGSTTMSEASGALMRENPANRHHESERRAAE